MKRKSSLSVILILFILLASGCGVSKVPNENKLKEMLKDKYPECFQRYVQQQDEVFEVDDFEILRRQTNKEEKTDKADCKITVHNESYEGVFNYTLYSNYYDKGGWQIDSYEPYGEEEIKAKNKTLPAEIIENEVTKYNELFGELTFLEDSFDVETGIVTRKYTVGNSFKYLTTSGELTIEYSLRYWDGEYFWEPAYSDIKQEWSLGKQYRFDGKDRGDWDWTELPTIYNAYDHDDYGYGTGVIGVSVKEITSEEIKLDVYCDRYGGDSAQLCKTVKFNIKDLDYNRQILRNNSGDYISIGLDPEKGIYLQVYRRETKSKFYCYATQLG